MLSRLFGRKREPKSRVSYGDSHGSELLRQLGVGAMGAAHNFNGKVLLYAEVEDGVISADLFSQSKGDPVRFRFAPPDLKALIYEFWEAAPANERWATMTYSIEGGRFDCSFGFADKLKPDEDVSDRRPRVVKAHFGETAIDYSSPG